MDSKSCCFIGHRDIEITDDLVSRLKTQIKYLIENGVYRFLFGSRSDFNSLSYKITTELKEQYPQIVRVSYNTKNEFSYLEKDRKKIGNSCFQEFFEEVIKPESLLNSGKAGFVERNRIMIDDSDYCIFYFNKSYIPKQRLISDKYLNGLWTSKTSGTSLAFAYAKRKKKCIINLFK